MPIAAHVCGLPGDGFDCPACDLKRQGYTITLADKVDALIHAAKFHYDWGGDEDSEGSLHKGEADFDTLRESVRAMIEGSEDVQCTSPCIDNACPVHGIAATRGTQ